MRTQPATGVRRASIRLALAALAIGAAVLAGNLFFASHQPTGAVTAISTDATYLDIGDAIGSYYRLAEAQNIEEFRDTQRRLAVFGSHFGYVQNPESGYLVSANNDPSGLALDGSLAGDGIYIGGPWNIGLRAARIADQAALWLANETFPLRFHLGEIVAGAVGREVYLS